MGLNACVCLRNLDELNAETALNGDGEIEGFNFPNTNNQNVSSTDYSSKLKGAGRMSYLMKVNTIDSGILKSNTFYNLKDSPAVEKIQSIFRGSIFRKKFQKNKENFGKINLETNKNDVKIIPEEKIIRKGNKNKENINNNIINNSEKVKELRENKSPKMESINSQNFSSESDEKKINNAKINKEKILINDIKENNSNSIKNNDESSQNNSNKNYKNKENNNSSKENKINDSTKLNYKEGSLGSSEKKSNDEENSNNNSKKLIKKEDSKSFSSAKISNKSSNSGNTPNKNKKIIEETINTDIKPEKEKEELNEEDINNFIPNKTKLAEKNFENEIDYGNDWKKYIEEDINSNSSEPSFFQAKLNDEINNSENLISTQQSGVFLTINGERVLFIGQYDNTQGSNFVLKGKGSLYHKNGAKYEGIFIDGNLNGIGRYINENGVCYEGIFKDGKMQKKGKQIKNDEQGNLIIYEGSINNFKKEGKGIIECKTFKYEGDFKNDKRNFVGALYVACGDIYTVRIEFAQHGVDGGFANVHHVGCLGIVSVNQFHHFVDTRLAFADGIGDVWALGVSGIER